MQGGDAGGALRADVDQAGLAGHGLLLSAALELDHEVARLHAVAPELAVAVDEFREKLGTRHASADHRHELADR